MPARLSAKTERKPETGTATLAGADHFSACLKRSRHIDKPYDYWLLSNVLPSPMIDAVSTLPFSPPHNPTFDGRRESNNASRIYFTVENQKRFSVCRDIVSIFRDKSVLTLLESITKADLSKGQLRIEYCQDVDGFWLAPHLDISVKLFSMLLYLSDDPELFDAGTDIFDASPQHKLVATTPYERNTGMIFIPGKSTWHGFSKRSIRGLRKSLIINYVSPEWLNKAELAYA